MSTKDEGTEMKTQREIEIRAAEIAQTCEMEYAEAGDEAVWQMAADMKWLGWSEDDVSRLMIELGL